MDPVTPFERSGVLETRAGLWSFRVSETFDRNTGDLTQRTLHLTPVGEHNGNSRTVYMECPLPPLTAFTRSDAAFALRRASVRVLRAGGDTLYVRPTKPPQPVGASWERLLLFTFQSDQGIHGQIAGPWSLSDAMDEELLEAAGVG